MNSKEKLYYLLDKYIKGEYSTNSFCDEFTTVYDIEIDYDTLNEIEKICFSKLCEITARYSPYEEDLKIPNVYANDNEVRNKAISVYNKLVSKVKD